MCLGLDKWLNTALSQDLYLFQFPFNVLPSSQFIPVLSPKGSDRSLLSIVLKCHQFTEVLHCCGFFYQHFLSEGSLSNLFQR